MNKPIPCPKDSTGFLLISPEIFDRGIGYTYAGIFPDFQSEDEAKKQALLFMAALSTRKRINILLADDDEDDRDLFKEAVEEVKSNADVTTVNDGDALMRILTDPKQAPPDIIFLDINMPCKNGQECLREIRQNKKLKEIPVVIYSTSARQDLVDETYKSGANFFVQKPDSYSGIKEIAKRILSLKKSELKLKPLKQDYFIAINDHK